MNHYLDITLLADAEVNLSFLWQKVYQQIHLALVDNKTSDGKSAIAVSFPEYECGGKGFPLGCKLRLVAPTQALLQALDVDKWLNRLSDYSHYTSIKKVPPSVAEFACFSRRQFNTNVERLARRRAKRKGETIELAIQYYSDFKDQNSKLPFLNMVSLSSYGDVSYADKDRFKLFIERTMLEEPVNDSFNCYGLSKTATVPWF